MKLIGRRAIGVEVEQPGPMGPGGRTKGRTGRDFRIGRNAAFLGLDLSKHPVLLFSLPLKSASGKHPPLALEDSGREARGESSMRQLHIREPWADLAYTSDRQMIEDLVARIQI